MHKAIILISTLMLLACGGSSEMDFQNLDISYEGEVASYQKKGEPFTGVAIEEYQHLLIKHHISEGIEIKEEGFYPTGEKERVFPMQKGLKHGQCKMWYKDGTIQLEETYDNGQLNGTVKRYDLTGELLEEKSFENGKLITAK